MKRKTSFFLILGGIGIICCSCVLSKIYKYVDYNPDISGSLPDTFRVELPLQMDSSDFFCIRARVNQEYDMDLLIDTGAESLARSEDLKTPKATFFFLGGGNFHYQHTMHVKNGQGKICIIMIVLISVLYL